jgi:hypothetical protein
MGANGLAFQVSSVSMKSCIFSNHVFYCCLEYSCLVNRDYRDDVAGWISVEYTALYHKRYILNYNLYFSFLFMSRLAFFQEI